MRQFDWFSRVSPTLGGRLRNLTGPGWSLVRIPVGIGFILGGALAILPIFGLWMIPVGLLLLAVDVPRLRRPVAAGIIRLRRRKLFRKRRKP